MQFYEHLTTVDLRAQITVPQSEKKWEIKGGVGSPRGGYVKDAFQCAQALTREAPCPVLESLMEKG